MKYKQLVTKLYRSNEAVSIAIDQLQDYLFPILYALGRTPFSEWIVSVTEDPPYLCVTTHWTSRGCASSSDYKIPLSVLKEKDPVAAAKLWKQEDDARQATVVRENIQHEISRLQKLIE